MYSTRFCTYKKTKIQQFEITVKMFHVKHFIQTFLQKSIYKSVIMNSGKRNAPNEQGNKNIKEVIYEQNNCNRKPKRWCW